MKRVGKGKNSKKQKTNFEFRNINDRKLNPNNTNESENNLSDEVEDKDEDSMSFPIYDEEEDEFIGIPNSKGTRTGSVPVLDEFGEEVPPDEGSYGFDSGEGDKPAAEDPDETSANEFVAEIEDWIDEIKDIAKGGKGGKRAPKDDFEYPEDYEPPKMGKTVNERRAFYRKILEKLKKGEALYHNFPGSKFQGTSEYKALLDLLGDAESEEEIKEVIRDLYVSPDYVKFLKTEKGKSDEEVAEIIGKIIGEYEIYYEPYEVKEGLSDDLLPKTVKNFRPGTEFKFYEYPNLPKDHGETEESMLTDATLNQLFLGYGRARRDLRYFNRIALLVNKGFPISREDSEIFIAGLPEELEGEGELVKIYQLALNKLKTNPEKYIIDDEDELKSKLGMQVPKLATDDINNLVKDGIVKRMLRFKGIEPYAANKRIFKEVWVYNDEVGDEVLEDLWLWEKSENIKPRMIWERDNEARAEKIVAKVRPRLAGEINDISIEELIKFMGETSSTGKTLVIDFAKLDEKQIDALKFTDEKLLRDHHIASHKEYKPSNDFKQGILNRDTPIPGIRIGDKIQFTVTRRKQEEGIILRVEDKPEGNGKITVIDPSNSIISSKNPGEASFTIINYSDIRNYSISDIPSIYLDDNSPNIVTINDKNFEVVPRSLKHKKGKVVIEDEDVTTIPSDITSGKYLQYILSDFIPLEGVVIGYNDKYLKVGAEDYNLYKIRLDDPTVKKLDIIPKTEEEQRKNKVIRAMKPVFTREKYLARKVERTDDVRSLVKNRLYNSFREVIIDDKFTPRQLERLDPNDERYKGIQWDITAMKFIDEDTFYGQKFDKWFKSKIIPSLVKNKIPRKELEQKANTKYLDMTRPRNIVESITERNGSDFFSLNGVEMRRRLSEKYYYVINGERYEKDQIVSLDTSKEYDVKRIPKEINQIDIELLNALNKYTSDALEEFKDTTLAATIVEVIVRYFEKYSVTFNSIYKTLEEEWLNEIASTVVPTKKDRAMFEAEEGPAVKRDYAAYRKMYDAQKEMETKALAAKQELDNINQPIIKSNKEREAEFLRTVNKKMRNLADQVSEFENLAYYHGNTPPTYLEYLSIVMYPLMFIEPPFLGVAKYFPSKIKEGTYTIPELMRANLAHYFPELLMNPDISESTKIDIVLNEIPRSLTEKVMEFIEQVFIYEYPQEQIPTKIVNESRFDWASFVSDPRKVCLKESKTGIQFGEGKDFAYDETVIGKDGKVVMEPVVDKDGNTIKIPKIDKYGNAVRDNDGNIVMTTKLQQKRKKAYYIPYEDLVICFDPKIGDEGAFTCHSTKDILHQFEKYGEEGGVINPKTGREYPEYFVEKIRERYFNQRAESNKPKTTDTKNIVTTLHTEIIRKNYPIGRTTYYYIPETLAPKLFLGKYSGQRYRRVESILFPFVTNAQTIVTMKKRDDIPISNTFIFED